MKLAVFSRNQSATVLFMRDLRVKRRIVAVFVFLLKGSCHCWGVCVCERENERERDLERLNCHSRIKERGLLSHWYPGSVVVLDCIDS